ncbi:MAG: phosphonoacetaldehyde reductase [Promethearchaeota archaeon]
MLEYIGFDSVENLKEILEKNNFKKIFLITGRKSFEQKEIKSVILDALSEVQFYRFNDFTPNPKIHDIKKGLDFFKKMNFDAIIAVGGGSVLDMGKAISIFSSNEGDPAKIIKRETEITKKGIPLIRIPTTAGSGSEATHFAVIYIGKTKYSLADQEFLKPEYVIVDPQFTLKLPRKISACSGMDALTQAIESHWNINSTDESKIYSRKAIELIISNLVKVVNDPDKESRKNMAIAANYAGKAINITKTTACHAISYPITSYFNVPHGHAVALTLPPMIIFNSEIEENDCQDSRGVLFVKNALKDLISIMKASNFEKAKDIILTLMHDIGLSTNLHALGIKTQEDIELIIKNGFNPSRVKNNPRVLTESKLRLILGEIR